MEKMVMGLFVYSGEALGNIVDIALRNVIQFYWQEYYSLEKLFPYF
jgi:hypothetical protein